MTTLGAHGRTAVPDVRPRLHVTGVCRGRIPRHRGAQVHRGHARGEGRVGGGGEDVAKRLMDYVFHAPTARE
jgi:hypothetical protein